MGNMIDTETISLLQFIFYPTESRRRHPITTHWTVDWDVATIIEALEELYPLQVEHLHLDLRVHQSSLSQLRNVHRISSLPCIYYTSRNDSTARKCWDALALSTLPYCSMIGLGTRPL